MNTSIDYRSAWQEARGIIRARRVHLAIGAVLIVVNRASALVLPATSKFLIADVVGRQRSDLLVTLGMAAAAATCVQASTAFLLSHVLGVAAQRTITELRRALHAHVMRLPVRFFERAQVGAIAARVMNDVEGVRHLVGSGLVLLAGSAVTSGLALAVLAWLNWQVTAIVLVVLAIFSGALAAAFRQQRPLFRSRWAISADVMGRLTQSLAGIREVKAYAAERRESRVFTRGVYRLFRVISRSIVSVSATSALSTLIVGTVGALLLVIGGRDLVAGRWTVGEFVMYVFFVGLAFAPLVQLAAVGSQVTEALAGLDRVRELRRARLEEAHGGPHLVVRDLRGDVAFENVWFHYVEGRPVLKGIHFTVEAGSTTALVGSTGSGKSTLTSLVLAFNRPTSGRVLVDGRDLQDLDLASYCACLGVVLQDAFLFDGTVADNIRYAKPHATMAEVREAARIAHCEEFVGRFPEGYDTTIGERGVRLSGGQRQRVAIARAILAEPRILILDEATSSLDSESEARVQEALGRLRRGRTTFIIAHRLSTIRSATQVLVVEAGRLVERGAPDELYARRGRYRELHDRQYRLESTRFMNPGMRADVVSG